MFVGCAAVNTPIAKEVGNVKWEPMKINETLVPRHTEEGACAGPRTGVVLDLFAGLPAGASAQAWLRRFGLGLRGRWLK